MDQELADAAAYAPGRRFVFTSLTRWKYFSAWNDVMATILEVWRQIEKLTSSIDATDVRVIPAKCHPGPIWND